MHALVFSGNKTVLLLRPFKCLGNQINHSMSYEAFYLNIESLFKKKKTLLSSLCCHDPSYCPGLNTNKGRETDQEVPSSENLIWALHFYKAFPLGSPHPYEVQSFLTLHLKLLHENQFIVSSNRSPPPYILLQYGTREKKTGVQKLQPQYWENNAT